MARPALAASLLLACAGSCWGFERSEVDVAARTESALRAQEDFRDKAIATVANATAVEEVERQVRAVPGQVEARLRDRRQALQLQFDESCETIARDAHAAAATSRAPGKDAIQLALNASDAALADMWKAADALDDLDAEQLRALKTGIRAACDPTIDRAREAKQRADRLEHTSHRVLDPLYGMGDRAEDRADVFNDRAVDAKDAVAHAVNKVLRQIEDHARDVREHAHEALKSAAKARQRAAREAAAKADRAAQQLVAAGAVVLGLAGAPVGASATVPAVFGLVAASALTGAAVAAAALGAKPWRLSRGSQPLLA